MQSACRPSAVVAANGMVDASRLLLWDRSRLQARVQNKGELFSSALEPPFLLQHQPSCWATCCTPQDPVHQAARQLAASAFQSTTPHLLRLHRYGP